jgi:hypothetical protein
VLLFNKDTSPKSVSVNVAGVAPTSGDVYRFDATNRLGFLETIELGPDATVEVPARSAMLIVGRP